MPLFHYILICIIHLTFLAFIMFSISNIKQTINFALLQKQLAQLGMDQYDEVDKVDMVEVDLDINIPDINIF